VQSVRKSSFLAQILAGEMFEGGNARHQSRWLSGRLPFSLLLSFAEAKERRVVVGRPQQRVDVSLKHAAM